MSLAPAETASPRSQAAPQRREDAGSRNFGMAVFDDPKSPGAAWIAVNGGEAKRVDGIHHLSTGTLWWSNLPYEDFFRGTEAHRNLWLRHDAYLVVKPKDVLTEWDYDPAATPPDIIATVCSQLFARIMRLAFKLAKECNDKTTMMTLFLGKTLRDDLRVMLPKAEYPSGEAAAIMKAGQAYTQFTKTAVRGVKGGKLFLLRRPRIAYALEMLTTPVPQGPFQFQSRSALRTLSPDRVDWVRSTDKPCMVEVNVDSMQGDVAPVYGFGNSTDRDRRTPRSWISHPEFLVMSSFSELDVRSAWVGGEYQQLNLQLPEPVRKFLSDPHADSSWSAGIIAESLWRAACLADNAKQDRGHVKVDRPETSWRGAWIMAADKASGFMSAMKLTDMGYSVASYGYGWVFCQVTDDQIPDLLRDGLSIGMVPRLFDVPAGMFTLEGEIPWGGDKKSRGPSHMTVTKMTQMMWNLDKLPLYEGEQRDAMLRKIRAAHVGKKL
jgi:hypothetical protein